MTRDELERAIAGGTVDTVVLAIADMEGRLQGKRLAAAHFLDLVAGAAAEGTRQHVMTSGQQVVARAQREPELRLATLAHKALQREPVDRSVRVRSSGEIADFDDPVSERHGR